MIVVTSGTLQYDGNPVTRSAKQAVAADGQLHVTFDNYKCRSAWVEIYTADDRLLGKFPFILKADYNLPEMFIQNGQKTCMAASLKQDSRLFFQIFHQAE